MRAALGFALALAACPGPAAVAGDVVAFTLSSMPLRASGATVHVLDARDGYAAAFGEDLPGDPERGQAERRSREGIPIDPTTWDQLKATASELGVEVPRDERRPGGCHGQG